MIMNKIKKLNLDEKMSIEQLKEDIKDELHWDGRINSESIKIEVNSKGNVTLTGEVPSYTSKIAAEQDIKLLKGVSSVKNELKVLYFSSTRPINDNELFSKILETLRSSDDINAERIDINVKAGNVSLAGTQDAYWKKIKAENLISGISNVINISNKIEVFPKEDYSDESIANEILAGLTRTTIINIKEIVVGVKNGIVTLSGVIPDWKTHNSILRVVTFTKGVRDIENNLLIKTYE